jgi:hypothetical protein
LDFYLWKHLKTTNVLSSKSKRKKHFSNPFFFVPVKVFATALRPFCATAHDEK